MQANLSLFKKLKILAIDDQKAGLAILEFLLKKMCRQVEVATSGLEGVKKAEEMEPDIILCDIGLPDIDGYEVARQIRKHPRLKTTRLIAVTAYGKDQDREAARKAGFDFHIAKPVTIKELEETLSPCYLNKNGAI